MTNRINERFHDRQTSEKLNAERNSLSELSYPQRDIKLKIVEDQLLQSRKARGVEEDENNSKEFIKPSDFDLPLNETLNIVKDYLRIKVPSGSALHQPDKPQEI